MSKIDEALKLVDRVQHQIRDLEQCLDRNASADHDLIAFLLWCLALTQPAPTKH